MTSHNRKLRTNPFWRPSDQLSGPGSGQWIPKTNPNFRENTGKCHEGVFGWDPADRAQPLCNRLRNG